MLTLVNTLFQFCLSLKTIKAILPKHIPSGTRTTDGTNESERYPVFGLLGELRHM